MNEWNPKLPQKYDFLLQKARYKVCAGGRGRGASRSYALALIGYAVQRKRKIVCGRQYQNSIQESIYRLLCDTIEREKLSEFFVVTNRSITCSNGSEFSFVGFHNNLNSFKSNEAIDILDVEEAESVTEEAWKVILPTVRNADSEIWIRFNIKYVDDPTYQRFAASPPADAIVKIYTYKDNIYFPDVLKREMEQDRAFRPHDAKNIWDGVPVGVGRRVWPEFDEKIHVKEFPWHEVQKCGMFFMAIDPASHYYPACVWLAWFKKPGTKDLVKWIYAEYPQVHDLGDHFHKLRQRMLYTGSLADLAREIYAHDGQGVKITRRAIDSRFAKGSGSGSFVNNSQGMVQEMAKKDNGGLVFTMPMETTIDSMRSRVKTDLQWNVLQPMNAFNSPAFYIAPWCTNLIESMKHHRLEEESEYEDSRYKDFSDALRICYAGMDGIKYRDPREQQQSSYSTSNYSANYNSNHSVGWMA